MEEEIKKKIEWLIDNLNKIVSEKGLVISGNGMIANNTEETNRILNKINNTLIHLENKVESLMDEKAQKRYEEIKRRFNNK